MEFGNVEIDQSRILQACQVFMAEQQNQMFLEFQKMVEAKDSIINNLNEQLDETYETLKEKQKAVDRFQLRQSELEDDIIDIDTKNDELKKALMQVNDKYETTLKSLSEREREFERAKTISDQIIKTLNLFRKERCVNPSYSQNKIL